MIKRSGPVPYTRVVRLLRAGELSHIRIAAACGCSDRYVGMIAKAEKLSYRARRAARRAYVASLIRRVYIEDRVRA